MYIVLLLLFKHRPLEKQWILFDAALEHSGHTEHKVSQFSCLFKFVYHHCTVPWAMCYVLLAIKWMCINCCKKSSN